MPPAGTRPIISAARVCAVLVAAAASWVLVIYGLAGLLRWSGARPGPGAQSSLEYSTPSARDSAGGFHGYSRFTADELNRIRQGSDLRSIRFVPAQVPSTGPRTVSVNPIDDFAWAAASKSDQNDRCYLILVVTERSNPGFGSTRYGSLPKGAKCAADTATLETVTGSEWPDYEGDSWNWLDAVIVSAVFWAPLVGVPAWAVLAGRRESERGRAGWRWLPSVLCFAVAWWFAALAILGSIEQSWEQLDYGTFGSSLVWCLLAAAVPAGGALAFLIGRYRSLRADLILRMMAVGVLIPGLPLAFLVIAGSII